MIEFNKKTLYLKKVNLSNNKSLQEELRNQVYECMCSRTKNSNEEYYKYVKVEKGAKND